MCPPSDFADDLAMDTTYDRTEDSATNPSIEALRNDLIALHIGVSKELTTIRRDMTDLLKRIQKGCARQGRTSAPSTRPGPLLLSDDSTVGKLDLQSQKQLAGNSLALAWSSIFCCTVSQLFVHIQRTLYFD